MADTQLALKTHAHATQIANVAQATNVAQTTKVDQPTDNHQTFKVVLTAHPASAASGAPISSLERTTKSMTAETRDYESPTSDKDSADSLLVRRIRGRHYSMDATRGQVVAIQRQRHHRMRANGPLETSEGD